MKELPPLHIHPEPGLAELRREVAALQARVAALEAQVSPGGAITCSAITVVDAQKQPVAAIDATGLLQCQRLHVERPDSPTFLTFDPQMGDLVIVMKNTSGGPPVRMVILNDGGQGRIVLQPRPASQCQSFVRLTPDGNGGRLELGDPQGKTICDFRVSSAGADCFLAAKDPQQGGVTLGVDGSGNGKIQVNDATGAVSGKLP